MVELRLTRFRLSGPCPGRDAGSPLRSFLAEPFSRTFLPALTASAGLGMTPTASDQDPPAPARTTTHPCSGPWLRVRRATCDCVAAGARLEVTVASRDRLYSFVKTKVLGFPRVPDNVRVHFSTLRFPSPKERRPAKRNVSGKWKLRWKCFHQFET